jgi:hypothetical protein
MSEPRESNGLEEGHFIKADNKREGNDEAWKERVGVKINVKLSL